MKHKAFWIFCLILCLSHLSPAAIRPIFILGFGGGYSLLTDANIRSNLYTFDTLIDFKEQTELKNHWRISLQTYILRDAGIEIDYTFQRAGYFSDLQWYGWWYTGEPQPVYIPINHFEDAYWSPWSIRSYSIGLIFGGNSPLFGELFPYATAGLGFYKIDGDPQQFLYRTRLSGITEGMVIKIGAGMRHRILPYLGMNLKISGETYRRGRSSYETSPYQGSEQFDIGLFYQTGQISRTREALARAMTIIRAEIGLELIFKLPRKRDP